MTRIWQGVSLAHTYRGVEVEEIPIVQLALRVFAICPNSASCERLFSSYGQILTRQRSRLQAATLTQLAELKMHLRDDTARSGSLKQRLKRSYTTTVNADAGSGEMELQGNQGPSSSGAILDEEIQVVPNAEIGSSIYIPLNQFATEANRMMQGVEEDNDNRDDRGSTSSGGHQAGYLLSNLFNYQDAFWDNDFKGGLDNEEEIHEIISELDRNDINIGEDSIDSSL